MGEKDLTEKLLEDYNDVFADIVNGLVFKGEQRVAPHSLKNSLVHSQYKSDDCSYHELERDIVKYWNECNVEIALCGIENQTKVEKDMPLRIIGYDGASYRQQILDKRKIYIPVVTIVLYFGTKERWNKPKSLKEVLNITKDIDTYVNDYRIHVFNIAWLTDDEINCFKSDFKIVANFFKNKRLNPDYVPNDTQNFEHVDAVMKLLAVMSNDNRYIEILKENKQGVKNMCDVAERLESQGLNKGLRALVISLSEYIPDVNELLEKVKSNEGYENTTLQMVEDILSMKQ